MSVKADMNKKFGNLQIRKPPEDINILLLGATGVGKSTFINAIANYITYKDIEQVETENDLKVLIPSKFKVKDKYGKYHNINAGNEDQNEYLKTGESATQDVKTYVFPVYNNQANVRIIDTPGLQDTRKVDQDAINCENILAYIGQLHQLNAICFLFEPNATRNTIVFRYCIDQMLTRLDKSASRNIVFLFTNTRGSDYKPGETKNLLRTIVNDLKNKPPHVEIPLGKNIFCFDNESFQYLAARKNGVKFDKSLKKIYRSSWEYSAKEFWKLIRYIEGDRNNPPLAPHFVKHTNAINEARRMIVQLAQPLAEIVQLINHNLDVLGRHEENLNVDNQTLDEMKKKLYMPVVGLDVITLTQPVTVCTNRKCAELYEVGGKQVWHYKQRCHDPCYLTNVPREIIGTQELVHCASMNGNNYCIKCTCMYTVHMHVYYLTKLKEEHQRDSNIEDNINSREKMIQSRRKLIESMNIKKEELDQEHQIIVNCCARFAHFLKNNAIAQFCDSYQEYIEYLINREKSLGIRCDMQTVHYLIRLLKEYEEAKKAYDDALEINKKTGRTDDVVTAKDVQNGIQELYRLKHMGSKIKELYEVQKKARRREFQNTEYVHQVERKEDVEKSKVTEKDEKKSKKDEKDTNEQNKKKTQRKGEQNRPPTPPPSYRDNSYQRYSHPGPAPYPHQYGPGPSGHYPPPYPNTGYNPRPPTPGFDHHQRFDDRDRNVPKRSGEDQYNFTFKIQSKDSNYSGPYSKIPSGQSNHPHLGEMYQGQHPHSNYPPPPSYPPNYPPRLNYPPPLNYPPSLNYRPPPSPNYPLPPNHPSQGPYASGVDSYSRPYYPYADARDFVGREEMNYRGNYRGRQFRGGRGRTRKSQKFKPDKKKLSKKGKESDSDSSSSSESSDS